ncbi:23626_t:CDS:2, partial [Gigaspora margarita]
MDAQTFRRNNEKYTKEAIKDLEEAKKTSNLEKQLIKLKANKPKDHLGYFPYSNLDVYEKEIKKLEEFKKELLQKNKTGLEFCSQECNLNHNAELCENCVQKCLKYEKGIPVDYQTYYKDNEKKTGNLCFSCKQKQKKELESELDRLEKEQSEDNEEMQ